MTLQIDTVIGNKRPSPKLKQMLIDCRNSTDAWLDRIEGVREQAHKEGFNEQQIRLLLKQYLGDALTRRKIKYLIYEVPRAKEQKKLREDLAEIGQGANMPIEKPEPETVSIPTDYKVVVPDQVLEEETKRLEQQEDAEPVNEALEALKPNYEIENLKLQLDTTQSNLDQALTDKKSLEEKYRQLEARTRISPSNNFPAVQGNTLRTKIVVNQMFREILTLKGSKVIYANVVIDMQQNKYVRLEPLYYTTATNNLNSNAQKKDRN